MTDKEKKELSDFRNVPFTGSIFWEDLDKDFLIRVLMAWQRAIREISWGVGGYHTQIAKRWGQETALEITKERLDKYALTIMPVFAEVANIKPTNLLEALQTIMIDPTGGAQSRKMSKDDLRRKTYGAQQEVINENHVKAQCDWCLALDGIYEQVKAQPDIADKTIRDMCEMDMRVTETFIRAILPGRKVEARLTKVPTLKSIGEVPVCMMDIRVVLE